jgi:hypothetical protein
MNARKKQLFKGFIGTAIIIGVLLTSFVICSTAFAFLEGEKINPENRIDLASRGDGGAWKTDDLVVTYDYDRMEDRMDISGKVRFYFAAPGRILERFWLTIYILDSKNKIVASESIASAPYSKEIDPVSFEDTLRLPEGANGFTFGYHGEWNSTGGAHPTKFGNTPGK